jgi:hypothetical protein
MPWVSGNAMQKAGPAHVAALHEGREPLDAPTATTWVRRAPSTRRTPGDGKNDEDRNESAEPRTSRAGRCGPLSLNAPSLLVALHCVAIGGVIGASTEN